jgi:hypothetical protein
VFLLQSHSPTPIGAALSAKHDARVLNQHQQQIEFFHPQVNHLLIDLHRPTLGINRLDCQ